MEEENSITNRLTKQTQQFPLYPIGMFILIMYFKYNLYVTFKLILYSNDFRNIGIWISSSVWNLQI